jgi:hypothetical protein
MRVKGKLIRKSLKTDTLSVVKLRLADMEKLERQNAESRVDATQGKLTFGEAVKIYKQRVAGNVCTKPRDKEYYASLRPPKVTRLTAGIPCLIYPARSRSSGCVYSVSC